VGQKKGRSPHFERPTTNASIDYLIGVEVPLGVRAGAAPKVTAAVSWKIVCCSFVPKNRTPELFSEIGAPAKA
jgi:hypothetical protein